MLAMLAASLLACSTRTAPPEEPMEDIATLRLAFDGCAPGGVADTCTYSSRHTVVTHLGSEYVATYVDSEIAEEYWPLPMPPARRIAYDRERCPEAAVDEGLGRLLHNGREVPGPSKGTSSRIWATPDGTWISHPFVGEIAWVAPRGSRVDPAPEGRAWHGTPSDPTPPAPIDDIGFIVVAGKERVERLTHSVTDAARVWREIGTFLASGCGAPARRTP
jgi:hypothetical protein